MPTEQWTKERTVKLHRTAITTTLGVQSVAELTRLTDEAGCTPSRSQLSPKGSSRVRPPTHIVLTGGESLAPAKVAQALPDIVRLIR